ncbi:MAG: hypothetical protein AVDCRST_MAG64-104 [uncultured Phycisphaerae bacterium]|uniref:Uncharacterized protein n=1 Tax=uncultured Phycisphaerae bacterium TaxID=904963 RepID=A0A6J4MZD1_9BACT|nr:MAG: hypothetical protein AVDCRST_MAG64-104 [uncultured Phycisphaerae bacterium]
MTDAEVVAHLRFTEPWYRIGIMDDETLRLTVANFRAADDLGDEHWRYGAFMYFMDQHPHLTTEQCAALFDLGAKDPHYAMGQSIMLRVLERAECPPDVQRRAATDPRTKQYMG